MPPSLLAFLMCHWLILIEEEPAESSLLPGVVVTPVVLALGGSGRQEASLGNLMRPCLKI